MRHYRSFLLVAAVAAFPLGLTSGCTTEATDGGDDEDSCAGVVCDDGDLCTADSCFDGSCVFEAVDCPAGETCSPDSGQCGRPVTPVCTSRFQCDDGNDCIDGVCVDLCAEVICEPSDTCIDGVCVHDCVDCDDGDACTDDICRGGVCFSTAVVCGSGETCVDGECIDPCAGVTCEDGDTCDQTIGGCVPDGIPCTTDADCDDDIFCNGTETCGFDGDCRDGTERCGDDEICDEVADRCKTALVLEMKYFDHAGIAEEQANSGQIPIILRENGKSLILQMPGGQGIEDWEPGTVILVQDEQGRRTYKYVVYAIQLANGTVAVIVREATLLSAVDEATMIDSIGSNTKTLGQQKVIIDDDFAFQHTIDLSGYSINLGDRATISWVNADIDFDFTTRVRLEINSVALEIIEAGYTLVSSKVSEAASRVAALLDDGKIDTEEDIRFLEQRLENDEEFQTQVGDILDAMEDSERLKDASVAIDGILSGVFQPEFILSASVGGDRVFPILPQDILVPLGPIPAQVSLNVSLVLGTEISGEVRLTTGMRFGVRLHAEADWQTRSATAYATALDGWNGVFLRSIDPVIDADAAFSVKAGVQPEIGLTLFQILGFTVNPEIYARLEAAGSGNDDCVQLSYELLGGFDASVRGEAFIWSTDERSFFSREWSLLGPNVWESSGCGTIAPVTLTAPATANDGQSYAVSWTASSNHMRYLLQESTNSTFAGASDILLPADTTSRLFSHEVSTDTRYYYQVAAENEDTDETSGWSNTDSTLVSAEPVPTEGCCNPVGLCSDIPAENCISFGWEPQGSGSECANTTCLLPGTPNITITNINDNRSTVDPGDTVTITVNTRNDGDGGGAAHIGVTVLEPDGGFCNLRWQTHSYGGNTSTHTFTYTYTVSGAVGYYDIVASAWTTVLGNPVPGECQPDGLLDGRHPAGSRQEDNMFQVSSVEPPDEACCNPVGYCSDIPAENCLSFGWEPQGFGSVCANTTCPLPGSPNITITNINDNRSTVDPGDTVTITVYTRNDGDGGGTAHIGVTVLEPDGGFCNLRWQSYSYGGNGSTRTFTFTYTVADAGGYYDIVASAWTTVLGNPQSGECQPDGLLDDRHPAGAYQEDDMFHVQATVTIFTEGFEGAFPGSWFVGNNNSNTVAKWGDNSAADYTGSWSAFCADNGSNSRTTYDNNLNTYMQRRNISLAGYSTATLNFKYWMNTEASYDFFEVNVRNQSGNWSNLLTISGSSSGWQTRMLNMNSHAGQTGLIISFDFVSDGSVVPSGAAGVWVDDVILTAN